MREVKVVDFDVEHVAALDLDQSVPVELIFLADTALAVRNLRYYLTFQFFQFPRPCGLESEYRPGYRSLFVTHRATLG